MSPMISGFVESIRSATPATNMAGLLIISGVLSLILNQMAGMSVKLDEQAKAQSDFNSRVSVMETETKHIKDDIKEIKDDISRMADFMLQNAKQTQRPQCAEGANYDPLACAKVMRL